MPVNPNNKKPTTKRLSHNAVWLTVLSDLMTNLMLFFLLLFAFTRLSKEQREEFAAAIETTFKGGSGLELKATEVLKQMHETDSITKLKYTKQQLQNYANVEITEQFIKIQLTAPVLFDEGKSDLKSQSKEILDNVYNVLKGLSNQIIVEGHTDNTPITRSKYESNWELSIARSVSVINYFTKERFIPQEIFVAAGYGEFKPLYPNDSPQHRALNRRVEIIVVR